MYGKTRDSLMDWPCRSICVYFVKFLEVKLCVYISRQLVCAAVMVKTQIDSSGGPGGRACLLGSQVCTLTLSSRAPVSAVAPG